MDFYESWRFLAEHKIFNDSFEYDRLWIHPTKINPTTNELDDDITKNTKIQIWLECFPDNSEMISGQFHDTDLDCGGDTFEEAIIQLAKLVKKHYTNDGEKINK